MPVDPGTYAKALAYAQLWKSWIGESPQIVVTDTYVSVVFTPDQRERAIQFLDSQVSTALIPTPPGELRLNLGTVLAPWAIRYAIPALVGAAGLGFLFGARR